MKPKSSHRYRICGTPVRTGCITCKIRRVKCGEEKPDCRRCTSTGRKCDGYEVPTKTRILNQKSVPPWLSLITLEDPVERGTFFYFTTFTAPKFSGCFSSSFWERRVIQASMTEPSVRHGVIALGAVHQDYVSRREGWWRNHNPSTGAFAFRQYAKAISHLHQLMSYRTEELDITLIVCILFICFNCLLGNYTSAMIHLEAGLKILEDIKLQNSKRATFAQTTSAHEWEREFSPMLLALGVQASCFVNARFRDDRAAIWMALKRAGIPSQPTTFSSVDQAQYALDTLAAEVMTDLNPFDDRRMEHIVHSPRRFKGQKHKAALRTWKEALERSFPEIIKRDTSASKTQIGAMTLKLHGELLSIIAGVPESASQKFENVLGLCERIARTRSEKACSPSHINFSIGMGLIGPLFFAVLRAPQESIQQRAYDLLLLTPGREGMWDNEDALRIAEEVLGATTHQDTPASSGKLTLTKSRPQHREIRTWAEISEKMLNRLSWLYGKEELVDPLSLSHGLPCTRLVPTGSGPPLTKEESLASDQSGN